MQDQSTSALAKSKQIDFPVQKSGSVAIGKISFIPDRPAVQNKDLLQGVIYLIEANSQTDFTTAAMWSFRKACEVNEVTCQELIDAFWKAYSDPYVGREGIQWRHLWKYIEKERLGSGEKLYTYEEMLNIVHEEHLTTEHFEFLAEDQWRRK